MKKKKKKRKKNMQRYLDELITMMKEEKGFNRLFSSFYEKYRSYERIENNVSVTITNPTETEKNAIGGLMGQDYTKNKSIRIVASKFEKALHKTKYGAYLEETPLQKIVECYYGKELQSKRNEKEQFLTERGKLFSRFKNNQDTSLMNKIICWIEKEENKNNRYYLLYKQDKDLLEEILNTLNNLLEQFPLIEPVYLPIFSSSVTRNPHAFDLERTEGKFLIYTLQVLKEIEFGTKIKQKLNAEEMTELLLEFNILRDDLTNDVAIFNINGKNKNGEINAILEGTKKEMSSVRLPLREVVKLGEVEANDNIIFMVENSSVSSFLINEIIRNKKDISIVCGDGMLTLAALKFLDLFIHNGGVVYYSGDFDPEGLGIAQRLLNRYGEAIKLWSYSLNHYKKSISNETIDSYRLKQLENNLTSQELIEIESKMKKCKKAGYQENMLDDLIKTMLEYSVNGEEIISI